jgi:hypothetical protein
MIGQKIAYLIWAVAKIMYRSDKLLKNFE